MNTREYSIDLKKSVNQIAFEKLSKGIGETFEKEKWGDEDFFRVVGNLRKEKKRKEEMKLVIDTNIIFSAFNPKSYYYPIIKNLFLRKYYLLISKLLIR